MTRTQILYYAAAACTAIAGIMHLMLSPNSLFGTNVNTGILFLVGGIAQLFWVVPMIRKWGRPWYLVGLGGTAVLIALWVITRIPDNPITGRGGSISQNGIIVEVMQVAFICITAAIIAYENRKKRNDKKNVNTT